MFNGWDNSNGKMNHSDVRRNQGGGKERARRTRNENDIEDGLHEREADGNRGKSRDRLKAWETTRRGTGAGKYVGATNGGKMRKFSPFEKKEVEFNFNQKEKDSKLTVHSNNEIPSRFLLIFVGSNHPKLNSYPVFRPRGRFVWFARSKKFSTTIFH